MIGAIECNKSGPSGIFPRRFEGALNCLGATVGEIDASQCGRQHMRQLGRQRRLALQHILAINHYMQMAPELTVDRGDYCRMAMTERRHAYPGDQVEVAAP